MAPGNRRVALAPGRGGRPSLPGANATRRLCERYFFIRTADE